MSAVAGLSVLQRTLVVPSSDTQAIKRVLSKFLIVECISFLCSAYANAQTAGMDGVKMRCQPTHHYRRLKC
jgi:hypothetical protein